MLLSHIKRNECSPQIAFFQVIVLPRINSNEPSSRRERKTRGQPRNTVNPTYASIYHAHIVPSKAPQGDEQGYFPTQMAWESPPLWALSAVANWQEFYPSSKVLVVQRSGFQGLGIHDRPAERRVNSFLRPSLVDVVSRSFNGSSERMRISGSVDLIVIVPGYVGLLVRRWFFCGSQLIEIS